MFKSVGRQIWKLCSAEMRNRLFNGHDDDYFRLASSSQLPISSPKKPAGLWSRDDTMWLLLTLSLLGEKKTKQKKTSFSFSLLWESGIRCLFCSGGKITCCWSQRFDKISWQTWAKLATMGNVGKSNLFHFKEKMRPPSSLTELCLSEMCAQWFHSAYLFGGHWLYWMIPRNGVTLLCTSANLLRHKMVH